MRDFTGGDIANQLKINQVWGTECNAAELLTDDDLVYRSIVRCGDSNGGITREEQLEKDALLNKKEKKIVLIYK